MEISVFLAKVLGIILILIPLSMWFDRSNVREVGKAMKSREYLLISGMFCLLLGSVMVASHNLWVSDWRVILTLIGWLSLAKGVFLLSAPGPSAKIITLIAKNDLVVKGYLLTTFILGLYLSRIGFLF